MNRTLSDRWAADWQAVAARPPAGLFDALVAAYSGPGRHYHSLAHLHECFGAFDAIAHHCRHRGEVALAVWFHDAVYDPTRHDNEERSAEWACRAAREAGADEAVAQRIAGLVRTTGHSAPARGADDHVLLDCDLWILGAPAPRFIEYEAQVRLEYAHVDEARYRQERLKVMRRFAAREPLYRTPEFRKTIEARARQNIAASIERLEIRPRPRSSR